MSKKIGKAEESILEVVKFIEENPDKNPNEVYAANQVILAIQLMKGQLEFTSDENYTFSFGCDACGKCCMNNESIMINHYDLIRLSMATGLSSEDMFLKGYLERTLGMHSKMPIAMLSMVDNEIGEQVCPFLEEKDSSSIKIFKENEGVELPTKIYACSVHDFKPTNCALFPLGRISNIDTDTSERSIDYLIQEVDCQDRFTDEQKMEISIKDFLGEFNLSPNYDSNIIHNDFMVKWGKRVRTAMDTFIARFTEESLKNDLVKQYAKLLQLEKGIAERFYIHAASEAGTKLFEWDGTSFPNLNSEEVNKVIYGILEARYEEVITSLEYFFTSEEVFQSEIQEFNENFEQTINQMQSDPMFQLLSMVSEAIGPEELEQQH